MVFINIMSWPWQVEKNIAGSQQGSLRAHLHDKLWTLCSSPDVCFLGNPANQMRKTHIIIYFLKKSTSLNHILMHFPLNGFIFFI